MKYIKTWAERCEEHPDHNGIVTERMIQARMQEEIDDLRAALVEPVQEQPICDECGKSKRDGWALYCVKCVEPMFAPPQRKPLSDLAISEIYLEWDKTPGVSMADFARAIERAHGICE